MTTETDPAKRQNDLLLELDLTGFSLRGLDRQDANRKPTLKVAPVPALHRDKLLAGNYQVSAIVEIAAQMPRRVDQFLTADPPHAQWPLILE